MPEPLALSALPPGVRLSEWIAVAPIGKTATYDLLRALGIEPARVRVPGVSVPVAWLTPQQQDAMDQAATAIGRGRTIGELATVLQTATANDHEQEQQEPPSLDLLARRLEAIERAQRTGAPLSTTEAALLLGARPGSTVTVRGRLKAEKLARNVWVLSALTANDRGSA